MLSLYKGIYKVADKVAQYALHKKVQLGLNELESTLRKADIHPFLQPIFDSRSEKIIGCEVLLRLKENDRYISPARFIHKLEQTSLINVITEELLDRVAEELLPHGDALPDDFYFSFNLSAHQIKETAVVDALQRFIHRFQDRAGLVVEIVERKLLEFDESTAKSMEKLTNAGVNFAIDDFGAGSASLKYIEHNGFSTLKLDKELTITFKGRLAYSKVIRAIVSLAKVAELTVIAEGVEDDEQMYLLKKAGVCALQGYYLESPMDIVMFKRKYLYIC